MSKKNNPPQLKLNFLKNDQTNMASTIVNWISNLGLPVMVVVALVVLGCSFYKLYLDQKLASVQQEVADEAAVTQQYTTLQNQLNAITSKYKDVQAWDAESIAEVLPSLTTVIPPQITLNELSVSKDVVRFSGVALDKQAVSVLVNNIQNIKNETTDDGHTIQFYDIRVEEISTTSLANAGFNFSVRFNYAVKKST